MTAINVRFAREAHSYSVWARNMAKQHPHARQFYLAAAKRSKAHARHFMRAARKWRAAA